MAELRRIIDAYLDGEIDDKASAELERAIVNDRDVALLFSARSVLHRRLRDAFAMERHLSTASRHPVAPAPVVRLKPVDLRPWILRFAAAIVLVAGATAIYLNSGRAGAPIDVPTPRPIATLVWADAPIDADEPIMTGQSFGPQTVRTEAGDTELQLTSGATIELRGRSQLTLHHPMSATLTHGTATFDCPPSAVGYLVHLPSGVHVIDMGTRFTIRIDAAGVATVAVADGSVGLHAGADVTVLRTGEGRSVFADGSIGEASADQLARLLRTDENQTDRELTADPRDPRTPAAKGPARWVRAAGDAGDLSDAANWSDGTPAADGYAFILNGGTAMIRRDLEAAGSLEVGFDHGNQGDATHNGHLIVDASATLSALWVGGRGGRSTLTIGRGGRLAVARNLQLGSGDADTSGRGVDGDHLITLDGGELTVGNLHVSAATANIPGADSTLLVKGGALTAGSLYVSSNNIAGDGTPPVYGLVRIEGGAVNVAERVHLGKRATAGGAAIVELRGGTMTIGGDEPFGFTQAGNGETYIDIAGGSLVLAHGGAGAWTPARLLAVADADFRARGVALTAGNIDALLRFDAEAPPGFTTITAAPADEP